MYTQTRKARQPKVNLGLPKNRKPQTVNRAPYPHFVQC